MHDLLNFFNNKLFLYYLGSNLVYLMLLITALVSSTRHRMRLAGMKIDPLKDSPFTPPISIICPARNEEANIAGSVQALLDLHYPELEVIVVNDGSSDRTLEVLRKECALYPVEMLYIQQIPAGRVKRLYFSRNEAGLLVIDKVAGGCKADAINAGLNAVPTYASWTRTRSRRRMHCSASCRASSRTLTTSWR